MTVIGNLNFQGISKPVKFEASKKITHSMLVESQINFNNRRGPSLADEAVGNVEGKNYVLLKKIVDNDFW